MNCKIHRVHTETDTISKQKKWEHVLYWYYNLCHRSFVISLTRNTLSLLKVTTPPHVFPVVISFSYSFDYVNNYSEVPINVLLKFRFKMQKCEFFPNLFSTHLLLGKKGKFFSKLNKNSVLLKKYINLSI